MTDIDIVDAAAANVARAYALLGYVAFTSRTNGADVRVIGPALGAPEIAEHFHHVADTIFNGPATVQVAGSA
jgi:hypothetical protein